MENARKFGEAIGKLTTGAINLDSNRDGKISTAEIIGFGTTVLVQALGNFQNIPEAIRELRKEGSAARVAFLEGLKNEFDLENDAAEFIIEDWLDWIEKGITLGERTAKVLKPANQGNTIDSLPTAKV